MTGYGGSEGLGLSMVLHAEERTGLLVQVSAIP